MKLIRGILNIIWILFTGIWAALLFFVLGALWCITIVGIPFGLQAFKFARLAFLPSGKRVCPHFSQHPAANILWALFGGILIAFFIFFSGLLSCLTIFGIPSGLRAFKFAFLALIPFGTTIEGKDDAPAGDEPLIAPAPDAQQNGKNSAT